MANFDKHVLAGIFVGIILAFLFKEPYLVVIGIIYSMIPDLDLNNSIPFRWFLISVCSYSIFMLIKPQTTIEILNYSFPQRYFAIPPLVSLIILQFIQHREFFHSVLSGILFSAPVLFFLGLKGFLTGLLAYYSHLILDHEFSDGFFT